MIRKIFSLIFGILSAVAIGRCGPLMTAQVEEPEVCITQSFNIRAASSPPVAGVDVTVGDNDTITVPDLLDMSQGGQVGITEEVRLTRASLSALPGSDLRFLKAFEVTVLSMTRPLMSYQNNNPGSVTTVDLHTSGEDLGKALSGGHELGFAYRATGQIPQHPTPANLNLCIYAKATANIL